MKQEERESLLPGDIVLNKKTSERFVVCATTLGQILGAPLRNLVDTRSVRFPDGELMKEVTNVSSELLNEPAGSEGENASSPERGSGSGDDNPIEAA